MDILQSVDSHVNGNVLCLLSLFECIKMSEAAVQK